MKNNPIVTSNTTSTLKSKLQPVLYSKVSWYRSDTFCMSLYLWHSDTLPRTHLHYDKCNQITSDMNWQVKSRSLLSSVRLQQPPCTKTASTNLVARSRICITLSSRCVVDEVIFLWCEMVKYGAPASPDYQASTLTPHKHQYCQPFFTLISSNLSLEQ